ncbi:MAG: hypothetical protein L6V35_10350 [Alistipes putredinis]|nr:MAG: hypothetical protein L6V35_10350 [Alistipes putredinis]
MPEVSGFGVRNGGGQGAVGPDNSPVGQPESNGQTAVQNGDGILDAQPFEAQVFKQQFVPRKVVFQHNALLFFEPQTIEHLLCQTDVIVVDLQHVALLVQV